MLFIFRKKLIATGTLIFHVSDYLRLFIIFFKTGVILLRYFLTDSVLLKKLFTLIG